MKIPKDDEKMLKKDEQPQLLRKVCHIIAKAIAAAAAETYASCSAEMSRKTERKWFVSSSSTTTTSTYSTPLTLDDDSTIDVIDKYGRSIMFSLTLRLEISVLFVCLSTKWAF